MSTTFKTLAALAAGLALSLQCQAATYSFSGFFGEPLPPGDDYTATFTVSLASPVATDLTLDAGQLSNCATPRGHCTGVSFYVDAAAAGLAPDHPDWEALALSNDHGYTIYYYFEDPAFTVDGVYAEQLNGASTLRVSDVSAVPEPASAAFAAAGLLLLAGRLRRRRTQQR